VDEGETGRENESGRQSHGLIQAPTIDYTRTIILQILGEISAGPREDIRDARDLGENIELARSLLPGSADNYMAFRVNGHNLEPNILYEDIVIIKQEMYWEMANEKVSTVRDKDGVALKNVELDPVNKRII
jgi:hypothetical protein